MEGLQGRKGEKGRTTAIHITEYRRNPGLVQPDIGIQPPLNYSFLAFKIYVIRTATNYTESFRYR